MSRADELRRQLAQVEAEESAETDLANARQEYRANPDDPAAKAAAQDAAQRLRDVRQAQRKDRTDTASAAGDATVTLDAMQARASVREVTL